MVVLGYPDTTHVTMAEMEHHIRAAARARPRAARRGHAVQELRNTVGAAVENAKRLVAAGAEFVKAEGGREILPQVSAILSAGIPFCGHLGMLPQHVLEEGGYHIKGKTMRNRLQLLLTTRRRWPSGRVRHRAGTCDAAGRQGNFRTCSHSDHRHWQRPGLRRADSGDADLIGMFPWFTPRFVKPRELRGGNQGRRDRVEKFRGLIRELFNGPSVALHSLKSHGIGIID
jgi:3-methyl-2-oxobutanoate hydroxymethyltransferase